MSDREKTGTEKQKKRSKRNRLNLRIDNDDLDILNLISFEDDESVSQIVRKAIRQYNMLRKNKNSF